MDRRATHISEIRIDQLWPGRKGVRWALDRHVNILSGANGAGKSTILRRVIKRLRGADDGVSLRFEPEGARQVAFDVVTAWGRPVIADEALRGFSDEERTLFADTVDSLFADTGKVLDRQSQEIVFRQAEQEIRPEQLSSGETQMLVILLTVLSQRREPCVLLMDEPEVSLHIEWQERLIGLIRELNPQAQVILTTHSPALIIDGWASMVTDVADIMTED